mmetsp:Transcript_17852/g.36036  ORF Transcript_17852/g.36036 Transcript_17852/m.36036 type:complete len:100 (+) Transcript_17852:1311-1610(+)
MRAYYTLFDKENYRVGFAGAGSAFSKNSGGGYDDNVPLSWIVAAAVFVAVLIGLGAWLCLRRRPAPQIVYSPQSNHYYMEPGASIRHNLAQPVDDNDTI